MDDGLLVGVQHLQDGVGIGARVEEIADVKPFQILIAVQLLVVGIGDGLEPCLIVGHEHGLGVAAEVGSRHGGNMHLIPCHQRSQLGAEPVVGIGGDMVKLIHGDESVIKGRHAKGLNGVAERGVGAHQHPILTLQERAHSLRLAAFTAWRVAEVPPRLNRPIGPEARA